MRGSRCIDRCQVVVYEVWFELINNASQDKRGSDLCRQFPRLRPVSSERMLVRSINLQKNGQHAVLVGKMAVFPHSISLDEFN